MEGIIYIATGDDYISEACHSAQSVKRVLPDANITIMTDRSSIPTVFDSHILLESPDYSNLDKVNNISRSPYEKTLFLDTDTYIANKEAINDLFALLEEFDFAACHGLGRRLEITINQKKIPDVSVPDSFAWFNSGVLAFRNNKRVNKVLEDWYDIFTSQRQINPEILDQGALRKALYYSDAKIATLPFEYNYHVLHPQAVGDEVRLLHGHLDNLDEVAEIVNQDPQSKRYFHAIERNKIAHLYRPSRWNTRMRHIYLSLKYQGVVPTVFYLIPWIINKAFKSNYKP